VKSQLTSISDGADAGIVVQSIDTPTTVLARIGVALVYFKLTITASISSHTDAGIPSNTAT